jgi:hypothetical protein
MCAQQFRQCHRHKAFHKISAHKTVLLVYILNLVVTWHPPHGALSTVFSRGSNEELSHCDKLLDLSRCNVFGALVIGRIIMWCRRKPGLPEKTYSVKESRPLSLVLRLRFEPGTGADLSTAPIWQPSFRTRFCFVSISFLLFYRRPYVQMSLTHLAANSCAKALLPLLGRSNSSCSPLAEQTDTVWSLT